MHNRFPGKVFGGPHRMKRVRRAGCCGHGTRDVGAGGGDRGRGCDGGARGDGAGGSELGACGQGRAGPARETEDESPPPGSGHRRPKE